MLAQIADLCPCALMSAPLRPASFGLRRYVGFRNSQSFYLYNAGNIINKARAS